ncbi:hypothetical protein [Chitinophaga sp.]|uniref:hypothetical protein n=1 Tax=Chitinophaga sp. TaxID=1869181 RepID=UPI0026320641|nr:hypothetical protein [uncultured Chitinophaga sp.]
MKIQPSPLELVDLAIINFHYAANPSEVASGIQELFDAYEVDMDFAVRTADDGLTRILVKASINKPAEGTPKPGYMLFAETMGVFRFKDASQVQAEKLQHLVNSGLTMTISYLRTFIAGVTGHFPLGKYWIPSIDLNEMIRMKSEGKAADKTAVKTSRRKTKK